MSYVLIYVIFVLLTPVYLIFRSQIQMSNFGCSFIFEPKQVDESYRSTGVKRSNMYIEITSSPQLVPKNGGTTCELLSISTYH